MENKSIHIGIAGPVYLPALKEWLNGYNEAMPKGMGGVPVNHLILALLKRGYKISVFTSSPEVLPGESFEHVGDRLSVYMGPYRRSAKRRMLDLFYIERTYITNVIKRIKPDIIHAHWQYEWGWGALKANVPTLLTCHDAPLKVLSAERDLYRVVRALIAAIVLRKAKYLTTVSPYCEEGLTLFTKREIRIIPNFEPDFVYSLYTPREQPTGRLKIVMINNGFTRRKNVPKAIGAFARYHQINPEAELHLYGIAFGIQEEAHRWCLDNNVCIKNVFFHGLLSFETLMIELSGMDVLLHSSLEESFGMILVEAMAMGIPVIAGEKSGGPQWILKDGGGVLVDVINEEGILSGLKLITGVRYLEFSQKAREVALREFSESTVVKKYTEAYHYICSNEKI